LKFFSISKEYNTTLPYLATKHLLTFIERISSIYLYYGLALCYNNHRMEKKFVKDVTDIETDFAQWYTDIVLKTELADYAPVKGNMVIRPYGFALWENIKDVLDKQLKNAGYMNSYFPLLIPKSFIEKEKEHVAGFAPELVTVTRVGDEELTEHLVIRPTSETIIGTMLAKWIQSYRELPLKLNQWCNIMRWEKTTRPFLRTSEFLWHECHAVFATEDEARTAAEEDIKLYEKFLREYLAIPPLVGRKSEREKFAGAEVTYAVEAIMKDGKSLQSGTSHYLGRNFTKAFNIKFQNKDGKEEFGYTTSACGATTRLIGAIVMSHGDNRGLVLPPKVAPIQVVVIPIKNIQYNVIKEKLAGLRVFIDDSDNSAGWKFNQWEMKGVPVRIEIGQRDIDAGTCVVVRRDTLTKQTIKLDEIKTAIPRLLNEIHSDMLKAAEKARDSKIVNVKTYEELIKVVNDGKFALAPVKFLDEEEKIKKETAATSRVIVGGKVYFAKAY
jgi:prolyl-tRNA synthetase